MSEVLINKLSELHSINGMKQQLNVMSNDDLISISNLIKKKQLYVNHKKGYIKIKPIDKPKDILLQ